jgi:hypothetical protein
MPPWWGPPTGTLGVTVPLDAVIAHSDLAVVRVPYAQVYRDGMTLAVERLTDPYAAVVPAMMGGSAALAQDPAQRFVLGLRYADGRWGEKTHGQPVMPTPPRDEIVFGSAHGTGGTNRSYWRYWVCPVPPPGPVWISCRWPAAGIEDASCELDGRALYKAAGRVADTWPQDDLPRHPSMDG